MELLNDAFAGVYKPVIDLVDAESGKPRHFGLFELIRVGIVKVLEQPHLEDAGRLLGDFAIRPLFEAIEVLFLDLTEPDIGLIVLHANQLLV